MITIKDIIEKRKRIWEERRDIEYDKQLVRASVIKILSTPSLSQEVLQRPYLLIEVAFYIVDKERKTVPFFLNDVQNDFIEQLETKGTSKSYFVLKGRQQGFTSLITAIQLSFSIVRKNFAGFTMADRADNTAAIFNDKARVVYERLPEELKPSEKFNSRNELFFDKLNSSWRIATATEQVGRSRTLNFVHYSEVAFYECDLSAIQAGIGEAITADAIVVYETTANGFNQAKDLWDSGACHNLFYGWWRTKEYRIKDLSYLDTKDSWLIERVKLLKSMGLDKEQIAWYCKKYNSYLDKNTIKQEYPITPTEAFVSSGECVFDKELINNQIIRASTLQAVKKGYFDYDKEAIPIKDENGSVKDFEWKINNIRFVESADGYITIHEEPRKRYNKDGDLTGLAPYAIGGDTAGTGKDFFTAKVICALDDKVVATLHKQYIDEDLYAEQMYCLGVYYHEALIGIEINYSRQPTRILQKKYNYPNLYMRERFDSAADKTVMDYGFETTSKTKPIIIGELVTLMRTDPTIEPDVPTLKEMTTFTRKDNGKTEALDGCHDDLVMACAIGHFVAKKQLHEWLEIKIDENEFIAKNFTSEETEGNGSYMQWEDF
nr:MAG TPA: Terminase large subunit [Caudoviricetes sp.]